MNEELMKLAEKSDNPLEFFIASIVLVMVEMIFRLVEVVIDA